MNTFAQLICRLFSATSATAEIRSLQLAARAGRRRARERVAAAGVRWVRHHASMHLRSLRIRQEVADPIVTVYWLAYADAMKRMQFCAIAAQHHVGPARATISRPLPSL